MSQILLPSVYDGLYLSDFFEPCFRCCSRLWSWCCGTKEYSSRTVWIGKEHVQKFPANVIRNQKYNTFTFIPVVSKFPKSLSKNTSISRENFCSFYRFCSTNSNSFSTFSFWSWPCHNSFQN